MTEPRDPGSAARSRAFYRVLGPGGLAILTKPEWDAQIVEALLTLLPPTGAVLDAGCGYGRIAIPLAQRGFAVTGLDIAPNLLRAARRETNRRGLAIHFDEGSMTALPYAAAAFDAVICLWTAFHELIQETEQVNALRELARVLRPGGVGVIDGPTFVAATAEEIAAGVRHGPDHRVVVDTVAGRRMQYVAHDAVSLGRIASAAGIRDYDANVRTWAGRERLLLVFRS